MGGGAPSLTTKNLQEMLSKLTVEEKTKSHDFWDTQPVPKLGEYTPTVTRVRSLGYGNSMITSQYCKLILF